MALGDSIRTQEIINHWSVQYGLDHTFAEVPRYERIQSGLQQTDFKLETKRAWNLKLESGDSFREQW